MTSPTEVVVAIDVGGTAMKCALVDQHGVVVYSQRRPTQRERGWQAVVDSIVDTAAELAQLEGFHAKAVGLVVPGVIDAEHGIAIYASNLGWRDVPFKDLVEARTGLPTVLSHDVRAGGLAEARLGGGRDSQQMLFIAIGTGIAGAYVVNGKTLEGAHGSACELGHIVVRPDGPRCGCGQQGCVEALASAVTFEQHYARRSGEDKPAPEIIAAIDDDPIAAQVWAETVDVLADGILIGIALLDPDTVVLGGGLAQAGDQLLNPLSNALHSRATFHTVPKLARAELGDEAGCIGAALLGLERLAQRER